MEQAVRRGSVHAQVVRSDGEHRPEIDQRQYQGRGPDAEDRACQGEIQRRLGYRGERSCVGAPVQQQYARHARRGQHRDPDRAAEKAPARDEGQRGGHRRGPAHEGEGQVGPEIGPAREEPEQSSLERDSRGPQRGDPHKGGVISGSQKQVADRAREDQSHGRHHE